MDKQIEEMEKDIAVRMAMAKGVAGSMNNCVEGWLSEYLYNAGYRKIPENAVIVSKQVWEEHIENWDKTTKAVEERVCKETAEKFEKKLKYEVDFIPNHLFCVYEVKDAITKVAKEITEK